MIPLVALTWPLAASNSARKPGSRGAPAVAGSSPLATGSHTRPHLLPPLGPRGSAAAAGKVSRPLTWAAIKEPPGSYGNLGRPVRRPRPRWTRVRDRRRSPGSLAAGTRRGLTVDVLAVADVLQVAARVLAAQVGVRPIGLQPRVGIPPELGAGRHAARGSVPHLRWPPTPAAVGPGARAAGAWREARPPPPEGRAEAAAGRRVSSGGGGGASPWAAATVTSEWRPRLPSASGARRVCLQRRSAAVSATAAATPSSARRGHGGRRRAGRLPPPAFRSEPGSPVAAAVMASASGSGSFWRHTGARRAGGGRGRSLGPSEARRGDARSSGRCSCPPSPSAPSRPPAAAPPRRRPAPPRRRPAPSTPLPCALEAQCSSPSRICPAPNGKDTKDRKSWPKSPSHSLQIFALYIRTNIT
jgi:hypothetical protein